MKGKTFRLKTHDKHNTTCDRGFSFHIKDMTGKSEDIWVRSIDQLMALSQY